LPARATWSFIALGLVCWVTSYFGSVVDGQLMPQALMSSFAFALVFVGGIAIYLLPTLLAMSRNRRQAMAIGVLNVFLGWTFLGWVVALVWACMEDRTEKGC
jgi:predicted small integral membrane protein